MSPSRWRVGVMALALCAAGPATVEAQNSDIPRLSGRIMRSTSVFDDDQRNQVITYVEYWVDQLLNDSDPGGVAEGRDKLNAPFGSVGATDIFLAQYAAVVITRLGAALQSESPIVRVNTMIVVQNLAGEDIDKMVSSGLEDSIAAVRYRAAKAAGNIVVTDKDRPEGLRLRTEQKTALVKGLVRTLDREENFYVTEQLTLSLLELADMDAARTHLISQINRGVDVQSRTPNLRVDVPMVAIRKMYRRLVLMSDPPEAEIRQLIPAAIRWLIVSSAVLERQLADPTAESQYATMINLCDTVLDWAVRKRIAPDLAGEPPKDMEGAVEARKWGEVGLKVADWKALVGKSPIDVKDDVIDVQIP